MFPAYSGMAPRNPERVSGTEQDLQARTIVAVQKVARNTYIQKKQATARRNEDSVFMQSGFGESSSDDDCGGVRMAIAEEERIEADEIFKLPEQRRQDIARQAREATSKTLNTPLTTFPSKATKVTPYNPYSLESTSNDNKRKRSRSSSRSQSRSQSRSHSRRRSRSRSRSHSRRRSRSRSRDSHRSSSRRDRSHDRRKKRNRGRGSSSDSDSDSSYRRRSPPRRKKPTKQPKYSFLTKEEHLQSLSSNFIISHRQYDTENYLEINGREVAKCPLGARYILGKEYNMDLFYQMYGKECKQNEKGLESRSFFIDLIKVAQHVPKETFFRKCGPVDGYWKLIQNMDILNYEKDGHSGADLATQNDAFHEELVRVRKAVSNDKFDIASLLRQLEMEDELAQMNKGGFVKTDLRALADRHLAIVRNAIKVNPKSSTLQLIRCDLMIKMDIESKKVIAEFRNVCHRHPHDPMVWIRYLDYIQYNSSVYKHDEMEQAFKECFVKVGGLVNGTLVSHVGSIVDLPLFRQFHLTIYIRYLKWQISCGHAPLALANIQATFEFNFGLDDMKSSKVRMEELEKFWESGLPRMGDKMGIGARFSMKQMNEPEDVINKMELNEHSELFAYTKDAVHSCLRVNRDISTSWVEFQRKMMEVDSRSKRTRIDECELFSKFDEDYGDIRLWDPVDFDHLRVFDTSTDHESFDYAQPLLELLGIKFLHSTGLHTTTEQVISEWIPHELFPSVNFEEVPTYSENTFLKVGKNILHYLIRQRHTLAKENPTVLDQQLVKYLIASIEMKSLEVEKEFQELYQIRVKPLIKFAMKILGVECAEYVATYSQPNDLMKRVLSIVLIDKFATWWEKALKEQNEIIEKEIAMHGVVQVEHVVTKKDRESIGAIKDKIWEFLDGGFQRYVPGKPSILRDEDTCLQTIQLHLYAHILRARMYIYDETTLKQTQQVIAMEIFERDSEYIDHFITQEDFWNKMKTELDNLTEMIRVKDENEGFSTIPEFPRATALCDALKIAAHFVYLKTNPLPRHGFDQMTEEILARFATYEANQNDWRRGIVEKNRDRVDMHFILDTIITFFSYDNYIVRYNEDYQKIILQASETFSCETKYMKKLSELYSTVRLKSMRLRTIIDERNKKLLAKRSQQFNVELERRLLLNTLTTMYSTMKICEKLGDNTSEMLYKCYQKDAMNLHDAAIWRIVMKAARKISMKKLAEDAYVRAVGQCQWALNIHIDYVDLMGPEGAVLEKVFMELLNLAQGSPHDIFMDDTIYLETQREIGAMHDADRGVPPRNYGAPIELVEVKEEEMPSVG